MNDTTESPPLILDDCWEDERDMEFNAHIHNLLDAAANKLDTKGPVKSIMRALPVIDEIRGKLIAEAAFRGAPIEEEAGVDLAQVECDLAVGLDALGLLIKDHEGNELAPTLELILDRFQSCKNRLDSASSEVLS